MRKNLYNKLLKLSIKRKKTIITKNRFIRLFLYPGMSIQTLVSFILNKFNFSVTIKTKTFWGNKMSIILPEAVSSDLRRFGFIEPSVASFIINYSKSGQHLIDVGSHYGFFSLLMSEMVESKGMVHSFEPTPSTFNILSKNVSLKKNISINNKAVLDKNIELILNDYGLASSAFNSIYKTRQKIHDKTSIQKKIKVQTITLDDYVKLNNFKPSLIKIDAESSEFEVLKGMDYILREIKPMLCIELGDFGLKGVVPSREIINFLVEKYGYKTYEIKNNKLFRHKLKKKYKFINLFFKK